MTSCLFHWATEALKKWDFPLTLLHSERPKLHRVLTFLGVIGLKEGICGPCITFSCAKYQYSAPAIRRDIRANFGGNYACKFFLFLSVCPFKREPKMKLKSFCPVI